MRFPSRTGRMSATLLAAFTLATAGGHSVAAQTRQSTTDSLIYDLKNPDAPRRQSATRDLGIAKFLPAIPALLPLASDPDASVRRELELTLEAMNDIRVPAGPRSALRRPRGRHSRAVGPRAREPSPAARDRTHGGPRQAGEPDRRLVRRILGHGRRARRPRGSVCHHGAAREAERHGRRDSPNHRTRPRHPATGSGDP